MFVKKSKLDHAIDFLRRELTHCVAEAGYVYARAQVEGIALRTLERASSKLNVQKVRSTRLKTSYWELPHSQLAKAATLASSTRSAA